MTKEQLVRNFLNDVQDFGFRDIIEIIANILIQIGIRDMSVEKDTVPTADNIVSILLDYKKQHGETLAGSLVQQGLVMMMWLNNL